MSKYTIVEVVEGESYPFCGIYENMQKAVDTYKEYYESCIGYDPEDDISWMDKWWRVVQIGEGQNIYVFMADDGREVQIVEHNDPK